MMKSRSVLHLGIACAVLLGALFFCGQADAAGKEIVYITAKLDLPFWATIGKGAESVALANGYTYRALDSGLNPQTQLQHVREAIAHGVAGIVISPTDSQSAPDVLE